MELKVELLSESNFDAWDAYIHAKQASIFHDSRWRRIIKNVFHHSSYYLMVKSADQIVGALPLVQLKSLLFGNFLVSMPYFNYGGIVADSAEAAKLLILEAKALSNKLNCSHFEIRSDHPYEFDLRARTDKVTVLLELPEEPEELWQAIGSKRRAQVKRPIREGAEFTTGGIELLDEFYTVFTRNMRDLGTPVYGRNFFQQILTHFKENAFLGIVRLNGKPVGAGFLIGHNGRLEIPWASTLREFNKYGVNMYLYWNILKDAIERDYQVFDFGRSSKDAGTLKFKKQWGGKEHQLHWYYNLSENQPLPGLNPASGKFDKAIALWQKMPLGLTNFLGPFIVKNLP
jgi:serine/alanine adding enzyme